MSKYGQAFKYHALGYSVMPLRADKRPSLKSWVELQTTPWTDEKVMEYWEKHKDANVGILTGKISGITVIDIDTSGSTNPVPLDTFPQTYTVKTPSGGYHLYYQYTDAIRQTAKSFPQFPNVDIRNDGGYVVAPPSVCDYVKDGKNITGTYEVERDVPIVPFPIHLFPESKRVRKLSEKIGVTAGSRNDSIASFIGQLLHSSKESDWESEVWPSVERANKTYVPPLSPDELRTTYESIRRKELERRAALIVSPIQFEDSNALVHVRKNGNGMPYKDMANVLIVLSEHPYYKGTLRYNEFRQEIEYRGKPLEDDDLFKIQFFMQTDAQLSGISKDAVYAAVHHCAYQNRYDEAQDWMKTLVWDGTPRLAQWVHRAVGVENDEYHAGIGAQWFMGIVRRIMAPGSTFDYVLVLVGKQGIGKTSLFRILGGPWYKSYTGAIDNKDFYLALRGAMIVDLDEGAALNRSDAIKIKSIITETCDEYRAPYDRIMKKYPRRFVFSMSTNDTEPFKDITGNRRYWVIDGAAKIDFAWLEENRDQLYAEAYDAFVHKRELPEVPMDIANERQETHESDDSWTDLVMEHLQKSAAYCAGDPDFSTTVLDVYTRVFPDAPIERVGRSQEMRIASILKKAAGMTKKRVMVEGTQKNRWYITDERLEKLQNRNAPSTKDEFYGDE